MGPATVCVIIMIGFVWTAGFYISLVAYDLPDQTPFTVTLFCYVLNGFVSLLGLMLMILALYGNSLLSETCGDGADCSNAAISFAIFLGLCVFAGGIAACLLIWKDIKFLLKIMAFAFLGTGVVLVVVAMMLSIVAGGMDTVNAESEKNFPAIRC